MSSNLQSKNPQIARSWCCTSKIQLLIDVIVYFYYLMDNNYIMHNIINRLWAFDVEVHS